MTEPQPVARAVWESALRDSGLQRRAMHLALTVGSYSDKSGEVDLIGVEALSRTLRRQPKVVQREFEELIAAGWITELAAPMPWQPGRRFGDYRLTLPAGVRRLRVVDGEVA